MHVPRDLMVLALEEKGWEATQKVLLWLQFRLNPQCQACGCRLLWHNELGEFVLQLRHWCSSALGLLRKHHVERLHLRPGLVLLDIYCFTRTKEFSPGRKRGCLSNPEPLSKRELSLTAGRVFRN